jgi:hypothetical protein
MENFSRNSPRLDRGFQDTQARQVPRLARNESSPMLGSDVVGFKEISNLPAEDVKCVFADELGG